MNGMMLHAGGREVQRADLDLIPLPEATESYTPVSHYHLTERIATISRDILSDYTLIGEQYALARQGQQLFAYLQFSNPDSDMGLAIGFRNSYDHSMSVGLAIGASVFVCDNLSLTGDIAIMKKHTKNVWQTLEELAITTIYRSRKNFQQIVADAAQLKAQPLDNRHAYELMGYLFGEEIISPRQITVVREQWLNPKHVEFQPRNAWSFYNAITEALKSCPPTAAIEKHIELHKIMTAQGNVYTA